MSRLDDAAIAAALRDLPGWTRRDSALVRRYRFRDFREAVAFVNRVADVAEAAGHHPDIAIHYSEVELALWTHTAGGITAQDVDLARRLPAT